MLNSLHIENVAVIERADIEFGSGFNVLTGETGAGKSIIVDSLGAVLGGRASRELVRTGTDKALVSAVFSGSSFQDWCRENDIEAEDELVIQRRVTAEGKSACRVNGLPVSVQQLRALGTYLLDIHGQNDGRQLLDEARHRAYLDRFGELEPLLDAFSQKYRAYSDTRKEIDSLSMDELEKERLTENLRYQIAELEKAELKPGEEEELTARRDLLKNAGKLTEALSGAYECLYAGESSAIGFCADAESYTERAAQWADGLSDTAENIRSARFLLEDAAERLDDLRRSLDFSPEEYDRIETRLSLLHRLERRYQRDEAGLLALLEENREKLESIEYADDRLVKLEKELKQRKEETVRAAETLTEARREVSLKLQERIVRELKDLSMPSVRFAVEILPVDNEDGFNASGGDEVRFLMSANAGAEPGRISKIASGGELSRIMLAMKSVFAEKDDVPSLVFDEVDTGVSGIAAQRVGEKMAALSRYKQLLCITHLPQIAALADVHFSINKGERDGKTFTAVTPLSREGRLRELSRLHSGDVITDLSMRSAEEQLSAAERFKSSINADS